MSCQECDSPTGKHFRGCPVLWRDEVQPEAAGTPPPAVTREPAWEFAVRVFDEWRQTLAVEMFPDAEGLRFMNLAKKLAGEDGALWVCSGCGKRDQWSDSWGYMGNLECVKCARQAIEFVACSETCRTLLERPSLPSRGGSTRRSAPRKVRRA